MNNIRTVNGKILFELMDRPSYKEQEALGFTTLSSTWQQGLKAVATGEFRPPKAGEWYLSGVHVEAYKAPHDLSSAYYICHIVKVRREGVWIIED